MLLANFAFLLADVALLLADVALLLADVADVRAQLHGQASRNGDRDRKGASQTQEMVGYTVKDCALGAAAAKETKIFGRASCRYLPS
eukprot:SAG31_NODE_34339_length_334_cov_0.659574_1_plen_87_part_00